MASSLLLHFRSSDELMCVFQGLLPPMYTFITDVRAFVNEGTFVEVFYYKFLFGQAQITGTDTGFIHGTPFEEGPCNIGIGIKVLIPHIPRQGSLILVG